MMIGDARKRKRSQAIRQPYDYLIVGHWHQLMYLKRMIVNGSLKGYDEYAFDSNFEYEPPQQAFWLTDARHGVTVQTMVHVQDDSEPWSAAKKAERSSIFEIAA